ncbi:hypothetical protein T484DRAFT_3636062 [Baffinella frigidus]|nr:hypothetical protein T484DRAFT_3636062 [Cryptophyta sp. CCMP2293]
MNDIKKELVQCGTFPTISRITTPVFRHESRASLSSLLPAPTIRPSTLLTRKMTPHEFDRLSSAERRIAREARIDVVLSNDFEPWSFAPHSSATEDAPKAAHNEEVLAEKILHHSITRLSLIFQSDELSDIVAATAAPPPPLRTSSRGVPDASRAWGALAQRFKLARPAPPSPNAAAAALSPASSCVRDASSFCSASDTFRASDTFHRRQGMSAKKPRAWADLTLLACEDHLL